jgi:hypothetical protein
MFYNDINSFNNSFNLNITLLKKKAINIYRYKLINKNISFKNPEIKRIPSFFINKTKKLNYFDDNTAILYGYKFHFVGRFTRKQQSANL